MRAVEEAAFARGISPEDFMDAAGEGIVCCVSDYIPRPGRCLVFAGKGNNGGDALVAAAHLRRAGWQVEVRVAFPEEEGGELFRKKLRAYRDGRGDGIPEKTAAGSNLVVVDGLLGLGSKPPLREPVLSACREINRLRTEQNACVFSIDQPTGLDADSGAADAGCVIASVTVAIGAVKRGLLTDDALDLVGRIAVVALPPLEFEPANESVATGAALRSLLPERAFSAYKNQFGRIGIVAGSRGLIGAAALCAQGALRGGAGLVRVYVREDIYPIVAAAAPAEAMIEPVDTYGSLPEQPVDVWAIGPGLGQAHRDEVLAFVEKTEKPMVIDADALTIVAGNMEALEHPPGPRLLTPHPGEMTRFGGAVNECRMEIAHKFVAKYPVTLLFKGSRTIVAESDRLSYNTTGDPAMASGGMGDVLTGICAALLGQKLSLFDAARVGAWVAGRAAELALFHGRESQQSLLARDVIAQLGLAFRDLQNGRG